MPHYCVAFGCKNKQGHCEYSFHRFPKDKRRRKRWEAAIRRNDGWKATDYSRICGAHFVKSEPQFHINCVGNIQRRLFCNKCWPFRELQLLA